MLKIELSGFEPPHLIEAAQAALRAFAFETAKAPMTPPHPHFADYSPQVGEQMTLPAIAVRAFALETAEALATEAPAVVAAAEAPKPPKAKRKAAVQQESAETATADHSAAIAEVKAELADTTREVAVEEIRAIAYKFTTDTLTPIAKQILARHGAASVSAFEKMDNAARLAVLAELETAYAANTPQEDA